MPTERGEQFAFLWLASLFLAEHMWQMAGRATECRAIEQATYDREFWELVSDGPQS